jgi:Tfp pilus assembly protein PilN
MATPFVDVNFLAGKQAEYRQRERRLFIIQASSLALLVVYVVALGGLFAYSFYLSRQRVNLENQVKNAMADVEDLSPVEAKYVFVKTKAEALGPILASQQKNQALVEAIFTLIPDGVSVSGLQVNEAGNITFSGEAKTFAALERFLANLERAQLTPTVRVVFAEIGGVSLQSNGGYSFSVVLTLEAGKAEG